MFSITLSFLFMLMDGPHGVCFAAQKGPGKAKLMGGLEYDKYGRIDTTPDAIPLYVLPKDEYGFVDWSSAIGCGMITPRDSISGEDRGAQDAEAFSKDIVMKPSEEIMPDVVFPHDVHNEWLKCSNCHPAIFAKKAGAANITMAGIWKGEYCGRCHDKVAFPTRNCFRCHSGPKKW